MTRRLLTILLVLAALPALGRPVQGQRSPARPGPEAAVSLIGGKLAFGKFVLGMTRKEAESVLGKALVFKPGGEAGCDGPEADVEWQQQPVTLTFSGAGADDRLLDIFVRFARPRDLRALVTALKAQVPELQYQPSFHDVNPVAEKDNVKPLYLLRKDPPQGILVGPDEGIWLSNGCWS